MSHTKSTPQLSKIARRMYGKFGKIHTGRMAKLLHSKTVLCHGNNDRLDGVAGDPHAAGAACNRAAPAAPANRAELCTSGLPCVGGGNAG